MSLVQGMNTGDSLLAQVWLTPHFLVSNDTIRNVTLNYGKFQILGSVRVATTLYNRQLIFIWDLLH